MTEAPLEFSYATKLSHLAFVSGVLDSTRPIGIDIETTALEPWDGEISTIQLSDGETHHVIDVLAIGIEHMGVIRDLVDDASILKIAHNAKFEMKWFMYHLGAEPESFFDTFLASQMIAAGDINARHDLGSVADVFTTTKLDKGEQTSDWSVRPLTESQLRYAAWDAAIVPSIHAEMVPRLIADDLTRVAVIEFNAIRPIARAEINGFHLDRDRWSELLDTKKTELDVLHMEMLEMLQAGVDWRAPNPEKRGKRPTRPKKPVNPKRAKVNAGRTISSAEMLQYERALSDYEFELIEWGNRFAEWEALPDEIPATLNPNSHDQIKKVLKNVTGLNLKSTQEEKLLPYLGRYPEIDKLIEYRGAAKSVTSYGENFLLASERDNRVHTSFKQIKDTGRMGSEKPNIQQIPHDDEYRRCFTAPAGRKLVIADYSQIELRFLAQLGRDANFIADFNSGVDLHIKGAARFNQIPIEDVTKDLRTRAKRTNFGVVYGIMGKRLGVQLGISADMASGLIEAYFANYPGNKEWIDAAQRQAIYHLFARTMAGRIQRFSHDGDKWKAAAVGRNGSNMPLQGSAADMLKIALHLLDLEIRGTSTWLVNIVHDEIVLECDEADAEWAAEVLTRCMKTAGELFIDVVAVEADSLIADEWIKG